MSYLALARKWRPTTFNEVVGQSHVLTALENALSQNKLHHAYLFSGTRGVGKTSIGRLFAKGLNCETGITAKPCGHCGACKEIDEGRFVDLLEIDAASRTKVEDTRELLDNVQYKPARGRFKVYLIDEVHMLSRHSFNALLKTLEEPPEYVKFLLATTDPQKLPVTILSRCLQFHLKPISVDIIHEQLDTILQQESVATEQRALGMIAHAADGSMRDALSLSDQAIALGNGTVSTDIVSSMLGALDTDQAIHLLEAMASKQVSNALSSVQLLAENGVDWDNLLQELASQLHRIAMFQALPASLDKSTPDAEKIELLGQYLAPQDVQLFYQIALKGRQDLPLAPTARIGLEMTVLRMMAFRPSKADNASIIELPNQQQEQSIDTTKTAQSMPIQSATAPVLTSNVMNNSAVRTEQNQIPTVNDTTVYQSDMPPMPSEDDYPPMRDDPAVDYVPNEIYQPSVPVGRSQLTEQPVGVTPVQPKQVEEPETIKKSPIIGLRHQLRSKRAQVSTPSSTASNSGKKPKAAPPTSAIERVAQQHSVTKLVSPNNLNDQSVVDETENNKPYQWKASSPQVVEEEKKDLTPTQIKQALEHTKTPEMVEKLIRESVIQDEWAALIQKLDIPKLVEQLALNSSYEKQGSTIVLNLRASQAHLNKDKAQSELLNALNKALGEQCHLTIEVNEKGQTPLELREAIYQNKLNSAHQVLEADKNVQFIQTRFSAQLVAESVRPI
ncbi:DNA polymerase III subunit gamma/tau [Vibrio algarum]|uniref:DNA polymerase III subunit gamma/tau n=1 Tax=Vibrio algarum TaxID=3020714 RepID=A0ABT4YPQ4_9VIBR|nr:DNA polymerase III subunit gamma/tau [Vibrio sp. KJ40-1]MDB1123360.1 DNA polymerase III subunit gamma/tau [Vibrio sp. KJ40-1]